MRTGREVFSILAPVAIRRRSWNENAPGYPCCPLNLSAQIDIYSSEIELNCEKLVLDDPDEQTWTTLSIVFKPQHNSFTGNQEIIVLIAALQEKDKSTVAWHDRRNAASITDLDGADDTLFAIVLNFPVRLCAGLWITWIVISLSLVSSKILKRSGDFWIFF